MYRIKSKPNEFDSEITFTYAVSDIDGDYIGNVETTKLLCDEHSIAPPLRTPDSKTCSIGFCEKEQKWCGWSHRANAG